MTVSYTHYDERKTKQQGIIHNNRNCDLCRNTVFLRTDYQLESEEALEKEKLKKIEMFFQVRTTDIVRNTDLQEDEWKTFLGIVNKPGSFTRYGIGIDNLMCSFF